MSNKLVMNFSRQNELVKYKDFKDKSITIIGAGATGSNLAIALAKIGFAQPNYGELKVIDYDNVSIHNLSNQYFFPNQIGMKKVVALKENLKVFDCKAVAIDKKIISEDIDCIKDINANLIILAVDDNDSRRDIMENIIPYCNKCQTVIEPGMSLTGIMVKYHKNNNWDKVIERWLKSWIPSSEQKVSACGTTATAFPTVLGVVHYTMSSIICHYYEYWATEKLDSVSKPLDSIDIECYNFKGFYQKEFDSEIKLIR